MKWRPASERPRKRQNVVAISAHHVISGCYSAEFELGEAVDDGCGYMLWCDIQWWMPWEEFYAAVEEATR